jgi:hypothetical protein
MKTKKVKSLTVRQQIQHCPTLTPEERSLALFGLNKAKMIQPMYKQWEINREAYPNKLLFHFLWDRVVVIKGHSDKQTWSFWATICNKIDIWQQQ